MTPQPGNQTIGIHILPNISRNTGNQTMKFAQLVEHKMGNIFLKKSYTNAIEKLFPDPFLKQSKVLYSLFLLSAKLRAIEVY